MKRETIGPPECPLFYRWTLWAPRLRGKVPFKVMVHRFLPNRMDADVPHDHPRAFVTVVLRGGYKDWVPCPINCEAELDGGMGSLAQAFWQRGEVCPRCNGSGIVVGEILRAPAIRFRRAEHAHMTETAARGAWTIVVMGPEVRPWGFWRGGRWWPFREFERIFGFAWRCDDPSTDVRS